MIVRICITSDMMRKNVIKEDNKSGVKSGTKKFISAATKKNSNCNKALMLFFGIVAERPP